jgi:hypothetical protein
MIRSFSWKEKRAPIGSVIGIGFATYFRVGEPRSSLVVAGMQPDLTVQLQ